MREYSSIFATSEHKPITSIKDLKSRWNYDTMGFFLNGMAIGHGSLNLISKRRKIFETSSTEIFKKFRNKGHGIHLYIALIETARSLGARQIRSDNTLNKFSRRMWQEKLARIYTVKMKKTRRPCDHCDRAGLRRKYFYIDLT
jgi:hypothetical protein